MTWYSQAGQDEFVHSIIGDGGFFVDVGAYDGVEHSNTYALETEYGWHGICLEANPDAFVRCKDNRPGSQCGYGAVSDHQGYAQFDGVRVNPAGGITVYCARLDDVLERCDAPPVIDYLSIDVEGHELPVLAGMDFERWTVRLITIEHNEYLEGPSRKMAILDFLTARGFECVELDVVAPGYGCYESWYQRVA